MEKVIHQLAGGNAPDVLGVCELESRKAFEDLLSTGVLSGHYGLVHYDSPDERGIDVALAYNKKKISILDSRPVKVQLSDNPKDRTRDILWVKALVAKTKDTIGFVVCHFPSRREGKSKSEPDRLDAAKACKALLTEVCSFSRQNLVLMGDFNDEPWDTSISGVIGAVDIRKPVADKLLNLMWGFADQKRGSYRHKQHWNILDQLMVSPALNDGKGMEYVQGSAGIMEKDWMIQTGKYAGFPLRTFGGKEWLDGYSDHFPVYMKIKL